MWFISCSMRFLLKSPIINPLYKPHKKRCFWIAKSLPRCCDWKRGPVWDALTRIYEYCNQEQFIFILDEWDYIYHQPYMTDADKTAYTKFLSNLLKDKAYVEMAYMTGICQLQNIPAVLNWTCFWIFYGNPRKIQRIFWVHDEVNHYIKDICNRKINFRYAEDWNYGTMAIRPQAEKLYNPRSVVGALWQSIGKLLDKFWSVRWNFLLYRRKCRCCKRWYCSYGRRHSRSCQNSGICGNVYGTKTKDEIFLPW